MLKHAPPAADVSIRGPAASSVDVPEPEPALKAPSRVQRKRPEIYYCTVCNVGVTLDNDPTKYVKYSAYYRNYQRKCKACRAAAAQTAVVADSE